MEIIRASELGYEEKMKISEIFVDGFYQWLHFFSKDKGKLTRAFCHMFNHQVFYVAVKDDEIAGITACTDGKVSSVHLDRKELQKHLGFFKGTIAYFVLKHEFVNKAYPFEITKGMGTVEFVATSANYRGQGVATAIIKDIMDSTPYEVYVLEVADTNTNAVKLYEKLGFSEFLRTEHKHSKRSGFNYLVYMKYLKRS
ncbi:GNAT family N-acetyltransferase [Paenibacillus sp. H1-7]|uniref:GNAT family N-acetyltransferase n=1 Tax=Paenibacillus sp. H1-7 TaxID=2282849 RepID=UPI001EF932FD|nr:GNAT family N-acetyltransferase [Paenibacillus sp. H1-7]ULL14972.1 GNAT family N-acetyltransferase [Paenibacillus sp. H1-7]